MGQQDSTAQLADTTQKQNQHDTQLRATIALLHPGDEFLITFGKSGSFLDLLDVEILAKEEVLVIQPKLRAAISLIATNRRWADESVGARMFYVTAGANYSFARFLEVLPILHIQEVKKLS